MPRKDLFFAFICFAFVGIFLLFAFEYSLSTFIFQQFLPYDQKRLLELLLLASAPLLSYIFFSYSKTVAAIFQSMKLPSTLALGSFIYLGFLSSLFAEIPPAALLEWSLFVLLIFFSVFWCALGLRVGRHFFFYNALFVFFAAAVYIFPVTKAYLYSIHHHVPINFFPFFINPRFFAQFSLWTLPLLPLVDYWIRPKSHMILLRILFFALASFWWALAIINGSRGLLLSFALASVLGIIIFRKALIPWAWRQFVFIASAIILIMLFIGALSQLIANKIPSTADHASANNLFISKSLNNIHTNIAHINSVNTATLNPRLILYKSALDMAVAHPFLGVGPMHFAYAPTPEMLEAKVFNAHPHNFPLLIITEWGIPAALALGIFIFILLRNFYQDLPTSNSDLIAPCFSLSLLAGLLYSLVSGVMVMPLSQMMGAIIVGNCLAIYFQNKNIVSASKKTPYQIMIGALLGIALLLVSVNVIPNLSNLSISEVLWLKAHQSTLGEFFPRFWLQGWLTESP